MIKKSMLLNYDDEEDHEDEMECFNKDDRDNKTTFDFDRFDEMVDCEEDEEEAQRNILGGQTF